VKTLEHQQKVGKTYHIFAFIQAKWS